jgi:hypothetical protein
MSRCHNEERFFSRDVVNCVPENWRQTSPDLSLHNSSTSRIGENALDEFFNHFAELNAKTPPLFRAVTNVVVEFSARVGMKK